jgi:hypothetical protein
VPRPAAEAPSRPTPAPKAPRTQALGGKPQQEVDASHCSGAGARATTSPDGSSSSSGSRGRGRSRAAVVSSRELVGCVLGFVAGGSREAREDMGRAALVCRLWRQAALGHEVWGRVAGEALPVVGLGAGRLGRDGRGYVMEQGRCLMQRRVWRADGWWEGLRLHMEVWDARDNLRMLSAEGRVRVRVDEGNGLTNLEIIGADRAEVVGPAFSAASRDPGQRRFVDMKDYFHRAHEPDLPARLCVRAVVRDARTGRQALLWESGKEQSFRVFQVKQGTPMAHFLPPRSLFALTMGANKLLTTTGGESAALEAAVRGRQRPCSSLFLWVLRAC